MTTFGFADTGGILSETGSTILVKNIKLLLGESKAKIAKLLGGYLRSQGYLVPAQVSCSNDLIKQLEQDMVDLLLLGELADSNCFEVFRNCRKHWPELPVILISHQPVSDLFREWVIQRGINDVFYSHPDQFAALNTAIIQSIQDGPISATLVHPSDGLENAEDLCTSVHTVKSILEELTEFSLQYFGSLAIGNYWRKSHRKAIEQYPDLSNWEVDYQGKFTVVLDLDVNFDDLQSIQTWINFFLQECQRIIVDFPSLLKKAKLSPNLKRLLHDYY